ncbi:hypothetical protein QBC45DRAFT_210571 [Copromyces sp. CBS 386.78]|nr:hypothetical protein QBC45DRAFT_210571 [Copromyces sp. CBS 386.78]
MWCRMLATPMSLGMMYLSMGIWLEIAATKRTVVVRGVSWVVGGIKRRFVKRDKGVLLLDDLLGLGHTGRKSQSVGR